MRVLGVDPGQTIGWCLLNENGTPILEDGHMGFGQVNHKDWPEFLLKMHDIDVLVIEDYRIFKKYAKAHVGQRLVTVEVIGATNMWATNSNVKIIKQESRILPIAQKLTGKKMTGAHADTHWLSAYNHAAYWLIREGLMFPDINPDDYRGGESAMRENR